MELYFNKKNLLLNVRDYRDMSLHQISILRTHITTRTDIIWEFMGNTSVKLKEHHYTSKKSKINMIFIIRPSARIPFLSLTLIIIYTVSPNKILMGNTSELESGFHDLHNLIYFF